MESRIHYRDIQFILFFKGCFIMLKRFCIMLLGIFIIGCVDVKAGNISDYTIAYVNEDIDKLDRSVVGRIYYEEKKIFVDHR